MTTDLTVGKPSQKLFWFSIPLLLSVAFQQLYQMADSIIVGRFAETVEAGELALAAVGASYPITQLFVAVATGINIGTGVLVSQLFGAKRYLRMKTAISTALLTTTTVALLLTLIVFLKLIAKPVQFGKKPLPLLAAVRTAVIGIVVALLSRRSIIGLIVSREIIAALEPRTEILLIRAALAPHNLVGRLLKIRPQILKIIVRKKAL